MWTIILNFRRATLASPIQNESYRQSPQKTKNNGEYEKRGNLSFLSSFTNAVDFYYMG